jgi:hypothetical protein
VAGRGVDRLACRAAGPVAPAIVRRAQVRAALEHLARDADLRLAGSKLPSPRRRRADSCGHAAGLRRAPFVLAARTSPGPFPDIADHVVQAVAVGGKGGHGRGALVAVVARFWVREAALPGVGHVRPPGVNSSPQANSAPSSPPRAANSHSASVGRSLPAQCA